MDRSKVQVAITAAGVQGSTIKSYSIKVGNIYTSNASSGTTDYLPNSGTLVITCTVTDSRGRTSSQTQNITVLAYTKPTISAISAARCNQDGTANRAGTYGKVTFSASITPLSNINTAAYAVQYREVGADSWSTAGSPAAGDFAPADVSVVFPADKNKRFEVRVVATDAFESIGSSIRDLPAAYALYHLAKHLISVGIGRLCDKLNAFQVGLDSYFDKNVQVDGDVSGARLRSTAHSDLGAAPESYPVFSDGLIYSRTLAEMRADLAAYETVPLTVVSDRLTDLSYTARYYPMLGMCFVRIYGMINSDLSAGYDYDLLNIGGRLPAYNAALAVKCGKNAMAAAYASGAISLRPIGENITASAGWAVYISGFWFV